MLFFFGMSDEYAKAHMYLKHLQRYLNDRKEDNTRFSPYIKFKLIDIILAEKPNELFNPLYPLKTFGKMIHHFSLGKNYCIKFSKRSEVLSFLKEYPTVQSFKERLFAKSEYEMYIKENYGHLPTREVEF